MDDETLYLNGAFRPLGEGHVHVEDRGFQLGDGVYEVIKVMNGHLVWLEDHPEVYQRR
jgi:D-alanine transaminase